MVAVHPFVEVAVFEPQVASCYPGDRHERQAHPAYGFNFTDDVREFLVLNVDERDCRGRGPFRRRDDYRDWIPGVAGLVDGEDCLIRPLCPEVRIGWDLRRDRLR